jgi:SAM-dependent methyltransferase
VDEPSYDSEMSTNPVRDLHDSVARDDDPVVASTRPAATNATEMRRMVRDVVEKLRPEGASVLELGCGTGVLGVPIADRASRYVGVDVAPEAVAVLRERLPHADIRCADVTEDGLGDLGTFDRVLVYATLHYVTDEAHGEQFVRAALDHLAPGGRALFGNLPVRRVDLPHTAAQRWAGVAWSAWRRLGRHERRATGSLPVGYCLPLSRPLIDSWMRQVTGVTWRWVAPKVGVPMHRTRADLLVDKVVTATT